MGNFYKYASKLINIEQGYSDRASDKGGPTKYGITLATWQEYGYDKNGDGKIDAEDVKLITVSEATAIAKRAYWDVLKGDEIKNQSIAEFLVDWGYNSGTGTAAGHVQKILGIEPTGHVGEVTVKAINSDNQQKLFNELKTDRLKFVEEIAAHNPSQEVNEHGWENRVDSFFFQEEESQPS